MYFALTGLTQHPARSRGVAPGCIDYAPLGQRKKARRLVSLVPTLARSHARSFPRSLVPTRLAWEPISGAPAPHIPASIGKSPNGPQRVARRLGGKERTPTGRHRKYRSIRVCVRLRGPASRPAVRDFARFHAPCVGTKLRCARTAYPKHLGSQYHRPFLSLPNRAW
uniref:Uncharacterized protein n=1 Tax=Candidatus Kentrum sp. DK TaxID=2126562 RepID=A0A450SEX0_9GAMM|nr:MAG: hypothetical protein BECKDK2373C_GA0170839_103148 [Candidatus Kentron sp. DK]